MIEFTDVVKSYSVGTHALRGISMQIEEGEFAFLVGPSGSGKSTIIKLITGELRPTSGTVHVNGYSLERIRRREIPYLRRTVGVVFQDFRLIENKTVYENAAFVMRAVGAREREIRERVPYVLNLVGLDTKSRRHPSELSGGQKQRVAFARALAPSPRLLLLDEPFAAMNQHTIDEFMKHMARINRTLVIIAHNLEGYADQFDEQIRICREV